MLCRKMKLTESTSTARSSELEQEKNQREGDNMPLSCDEEPGECWKVNLSWNIHVTI